MAARREAQRHRLDVNLSTVELVQSLLEEVGTPVSRNWLLHRMSRQGHATTRGRLNRVLGHFFKLGLAVEGSKGVQWTHNMSPARRRAIAVGKRL